MYFVIITTTTFPAQPADSFVMISRVAVDGIQRPRSQYS